MFYHRLALAMGRTKEELLLTMSAKELTDWMAFSTIEPFGDERADLRTASIVQAVYSPHLKKGKSLTLGNCMLKFGPRKPMDYKTIKANIGSALRGRRNGNG